MNRKMSFILMAMVLIGFLSGCSLKKMLANNMAGTLDDTAKEFFAEKNPRMGREAAPGLLKTLDGIIAGSPYNKDLLLLGAKLNGGFALAFIEDEDKAWARELYDKGFQLALRAFDDEEINGALKKNKEDLKKVLEGYGSGWVPWMFWAGNCMASSINLRRDEPCAIAELAVAKVFIDRIIELKRGDYFHGGPYVVLGIFWGSRSKLGGNSDLSRKYFEKALSLNKRKFLLFHVLYAKYYAVYADCLECHNGEKRALFCKECQGKGSAGGKECQPCKGYGKFYCSHCEGTGQELKTFRELLAEVEKAPKNLLPEEALANKVAKKKGRDMMAHLKKYFNFPIKPSKDPFQKKLSKDELDKKKKEDKEIFEDMQKD